MSRMEKMTTITEDTFAYLVAEEVKNKLSPSQRNVLLEKENWHNWQRCLITLVQNLEEQIADINEDANADDIRFGQLGSRRLQTEARNTYNNRRHKIERFKFHVNKRLDQVTAMIETGSAVKSDGWEQVEFLRNAISTHRQMLNKHDMEATPIDEALWASLGNKWEFDKINESEL